MTAPGAMRVQRSHGSCQDCGQPACAADRLLGLDGWLTARARRMACLAGIPDPFRKAEELMALAERPEGSEYGDRAPQG